MGSEVAVHLMGRYPAFAFSSPLHSPSVSVAELQQLAEGHQEPYLLRWDQPQSKCSPTVDSPPGSAPTPRVPGLQALHSLGSAWCPAASS